MLVNEVNEVYERLINEFGIDEEVLNVVTSINGYTIEAMNDVLYYYTGYRDLTQCDEY